MTRIAFGIAAQVVAAVAIPILVLYAAAAFDEALTSIGIATHLGF